jgi:hypothetical protein
MAATDDFLPAARAELPGCPDATIRDAIRRVVARFLRHTYAWVEVETLTVEAGKTSIAFGGAVPFVALKVEGPRADGNPVGVALANDLRAAAVATGPLKYIAIDGAGGLVLWPAPTSRTILTVVVSKCTKRDGDELPDEVADLWFDAIVNGTLAELKSKTGKPWHDPEGAAVAQAAYVSESSDARRRSVSSGAAPLRVASGLASWP